MTNPLRTARRHCGARMDRHALSSSGERQRRGRGLPRSRARCIARRDGTGAGSTACRIRATGAKPTGAKPLLDAAGRHLRRVPLTELAPGDVIVFRLRPRTVAKHAAILATPQTMIHAMEGTAAAEVAFSPWWRRRLAGVFRFPD